MRRHDGARVLSVGLVTALLLAGSVGEAGSWGWFFHHDQGPPCTLAGVGASIDAADRKIRAAGTIVIKQPDVWGQDRMTWFRRDFDLRMKAELDRFQPVLSAEVARSEAAAIVGQAGIAVPLAALPATSDNTSIPPALKDRFQGLAPTVTGLNIEPTVVLDEKKRFLDHGYELLRVNLGDDTADAAGYGLYLFRLPVSIDPGGTTCKGWGGLLTVTVRHEFGPTFVTQTFRNLVINDLVDLLAPMIAELIRADGWRPRLAEFETAAYRFRKNGGAVAEQEELIGCVQRLKLPIAPSRLWKGYYPIASADLANVLLVESFYRIAAEVQDRLHSNAPRGSEVRNLLRQELEVAYDLMRSPDGRTGPLADIGLIESIVEQIHTRQFEGPQGTIPARLAPPGIPARDLETNALAPAYRDLMKRLPGNLEQRAMGSFCWAIAIEAGLLNRQIREDMWRLGGTKAFVCPGNLQELFFYLPMPTPDTECAFCEYVKNRWPLVAFALDPVTDQQNIADAYQRSRDLQLTLTGAFAAGKIGAHALAKLMRQARYDAEALTLNRTVTAFAHGPDTFGWRFYPRYQAPREEPSGLFALTGVLGGGFDPYKTARLEPGQRELTAVIVVPSFLRYLRVETASNWFKLGNPAAQRLATAEMLEQGRCVVMLRQGLACTGDAGQYRPDDVTRLATRIDQLERMLPLQTHVLGLPYDHTLGGFELFTQGAMSLVPELTGYEGVEGIDPTRETDLLLLGKHLSLSGTRVLVSGMNVPEDVIDFITRRALRVKLPAGLAPTAAINAGESTLPAYEVFVVTPGGTSNRLVIPWVAPASTATTELAPAFELGDAALEIIVEVDRLESGTATATATASASASASASAKTSGRLRSFRSRVDAKSRVRIVARTPALAPPAIEVGIALGTHGGKSLASFHLPWAIQLDTDAGGYTLRAPELAALADHVAHALAANGLLDSAASPLVLDAGTIHVASAVAVGIPSHRPAPVAGTLRISVRQEASAPVPPAPAPAEQSLPPPLPLDGPSPHAKAPKTGAAAAP